MRTCARVRHLRRGKNPKVGKNLLDEVYREIRLNVLLWITTPAVQFMDSKVHHECLFVRSELLVELEQESRRL